MKLFFEYGSTRFVVIVHERDRRSLTINVHPDMRVEAIVPSGKPLEEVKSRILRKAPWIVKQLNYFDQFHPLQPPREYVSGETHYYLGRQYRLKIRLGEKRRVRLVGKFFEVELPEPMDSSSAKKVMRDWYRKHASEMFNRKVDGYYPWFAKRGAAYPKIILRTMTSRWGSCTGHGTITLNTELIKAPLVCIDYVIIHELCHLVHPNHDKKFYRLMSAAMPDWERWKDRLERTVIG